VLNPRQEAFCLAYARTGNATRAALEAGYSPKGIDAAAARLLGNARVRDRLKELAEQTASSKIANAVERQEFWTSLMRDPAHEVKDRLKASELLGKAQGDFIDRTEVSGPNGAGLELVITRRIIAADAEP
jgi:phage terminase small subunit